MFFFFFAVGVFAWNSAVVIDVGSTGSRVHALQWRKLEYGDCPGGIEIEIPVKSWKKTPGFGTYILNSEGENLENAVAEYLKQLKSGLDALLPNPDPGTPLWFQGTGGLRQLQPNLLFLVLHLVREQLDTKWKGYHVPEAGVGVLPGEQEAIYSWLSLVQILHAFEQGSDLQFLRSKPLETVSKKPALIELGGASAQIVVNPPFQKKLLQNNRGTKSAPVRQLEGNPRFSALGFCGTEHAVYARSLQGLGRQLSLQRYICEGSRRLKSSRLHCLPEDLLFPRFSDCDIMGTTEDLAVLDLDLTVDGIRGFANSTFEQCRQAVGRVIFDAHADLRIPFALAESMEVVATESFYHLYSMVVDPTGSLQARVTVDDFRGKAKELCALGTSALVAPLLHENAEFEKAASACFGLTFAADLLELFGVPANRSLSAVNDVGGIDLGWPVGFALLQLPRFVEPPTKRPHDEL